MYVVTTRLSRRLRWFKWWSQRIRVLIKRNKKKISTDCHHQIGINLIAPGSATTLNIPHHLTIRNNDSLSDIQPKLVVVFTSGHYTQTS